MTIQHLVNIQNKPFGYEYLQIEDGFFLDYYFRD